ncbi:DUF1254 domain-containing protein [Zhongshania sp.]|uniref:DUF1254 domain-containing protein n=1 Tax=Zhongshania sp. TaxID=1971902 RepID=UPI0035678968
MKLLKWCLVILLCAYLGQYLLALVLPNLVMELLYQRGGVKQAYNTLYIKPRADETSREIVRPSPDLFYGSCIYNLAEGPLLIEAKVPERYWSMQFYQMNTDNYAGMSNRRDEHYRIGTLVRVILIGPGSNPKDYSGEVIQSPSQRGIVLLRASGIGEPSGAIAALEQSRCGPV